MSPRKVSPHDRSTDFGRRMTERRLTLGLTQRDVADAASLTQAAINHFERGRRLPAIPNAIRVAKALGTTVEWLALGEDRIAGLESRIVRVEDELHKLDARTVGSIVFGGPRQ